MHVTLKEDAWYKQLAVIFSKHVQRFFMTQACSSLDMMMLMVICTVLYMTWLWVKDLTTRYICQVIYQTQQNPCVWFVTDTWPSLQRNPAVSRHRTFKDQCLPLRPKHGTQSAKNTTGPSPSSSASETFRGTEGGRCGNAALLQSSTKRKMAYMCPSEEIWSVNRIPPRQTGPRDNLSTFGGLWYCAITMATCPSCRARGETRKRDITVTEATSWLDTVQICQPFNVE